MNIQRIKKRVIRQIVRFTKRHKRSVKTFIVRNRHIRASRKLAKMEAQKALLAALKFSRKQVAIRPRIRLISKFTLVLVIAFVIFNQIASYLKSREAEIKVNGQTILVAEKTEPRETTGLEISQVISPRLSPFAFKKPVDGYISQGFRAYHQANDIATDLGTPIHPVGSGVVEFAGRLVDGRGNVVIVDHGDGLKSLYAHMGRIDVGVGNMVNSNITIGTIGLTGHTTGPHVHLEVYDNGITVDPASILPQE